MEGSKQTELLCFSLTYLTDYSVMNVAHLLGDSYHLILLSHLPIAGLNILHSVSNSTDHNYTFLIRNH